MLMRVAKKAIVWSITLEAKLIIRRFRPRIVAVTGSVGKTSTKDAIYALYSAHWHTRKSEKSFNSEVGVPLTIIGTNNAWRNPLGWLKNIVKGVLVLTLRHEYPAWLILEIGADRPGDIRSTARWLSIDVVVFTRLPDVPVHVEYFPSPEAVAEEKLSLLQGLTPGGTIVYNLDDTTISQGLLADAHRKISFGFSADADVSLVDMELVSEGDIPQGISFHVHHGKETAKVFLTQSLGKQHVYPALAALACGLAQGLTLAQGVKALKNFTPPPGRMRIISGVKNTWVIDDTYNSSPVALQEALLVLGSLSSKGKRIAVLADMMELGSYSVDAHRFAGVQAAQVCDILVTVGIRARGMAQAAAKAGLSKKKIFEYDSSREAGKAVEQMLNPGDIVLVKGSQSMRMERVVEEIMTEPERKNELLVRQDSEWERR